MNAVMFITFQMLGFGIDGGGILMNPAIQSDKVIQVWDVLEPLPLVVTRPVPILVGIFLFGIAHAYFYRSFRLAWRAGVAWRGLALASLVFVMTFLFWEFFTPFNLFGEPLPLIALELAFWTLIALADGFAIAAVMERGLSRPS
ncbi:MAG: hypothetical protein AB1778_05780 [Candidatus Bipolaricaulota bacterium]